TGDHAKSWGWLVNVTAEQLANHLNATSSRIIDLETFKIGGERRYAAVMVSNTGADAKAWGWLNGGTAQQVNDHMAMYQERIVDLDTYVAGGTRYYNIVTIANTGADAKAWWYYYNVDWSFIQAKLSQHHARLTDIERVGPGQYTVVMEHNPGIYWWVLFNSSASHVLNVAAQHGVRVFDVETYIDPDTNQRRFIALMINNSNKLTSKIRNLVEDAFQGSAWGFYLKRVGGKVLAALQSHHKFEPASAIKVLHHVHAMRRVQAGMDSLDADVTW